MPYSPMMGPAGDAMGPGMGPGQAAASPETEEGQNALLPRALFGDDVKPGDTITLKVSAVYGDEVEVLATSTAGEPPEEEDEEEEGEEQESPMMTADEEFEAAVGKDTYGNRTTMG